jgi:hypothetical protein
VSWFLGLVIFYVSVLLVAFLWLVVERTLLSGEG